MIHVLGLIGWALIAGVAYLLFLLVFGLAAAGVLRLGQRLGLLKDPGRRGPGTEAGTRTASRIQARMKQMARPTLLLTPTKEPVFSKLGGRPELASDLGWPAVDGAPRSFVAQIDLRELGDAGRPDWLPAEGRIYAFKDSTGFGRADDTTVLFSSGPPGPEVDPPPALGSKHRFGERRARFLPMISFPSLDWLAIDLATLELTDADLDDLANAPNEPFGDELQHRIGGYPAEVQDGQMQVECEFLARGLSRNYREPVPEAIARAARQWRLLLQIDSDPELGMNWGDSGRLYVFIKEKHARVGDFSKTVSLWQTY